MGKVEDFIEKYYRYALQSEDDINIPTLFTLAQAALETGWGGKSISNNLFGITADSNWDGKKQLVDTFEIHDNPDVKYPKIKSIEKQDDGTYRYEVQRWFRAYDDVAECFNDHNKFLLKSRYRKAFNHIDDPKKFATEVADAGYATGRNYAKVLHDIIDRIKVVIEKLEIDRKYSDIGRVNVRNLNVRSIPSLRGKRLGRVHRNDRLRLLDSHRRWYKIRHRTAWISAKYVDRRNRVTANSLNVRAWPMGEIVDELKKGDPVKILKKEDGWLKIILQEWWVFATYIDVLKQNKDNE